VAIPKTATERTFALDRIEYLETALDIGWPPVDGVEVAAPRRQTGPGIIWDRPGAVLDLTCAQGDRDAIVALWDKHARRVLDALGWHAQCHTARRFEGGVTLAISAPMDQLYTAIFAAEAAWHFCACQITDTESEPFAPLMDQIRDVMDTERNPTLIALIDAADAHGVDILSDDDEVSLGHGTGSHTFAATALPMVQDVDWAHVHDIPVALITGTNGKTTTTRLCAAMARAAGKVVGLTTTDVVQVGDEILDRGDYSGPQGARMVLRDPRVEIACLEVARGGILRRGLSTRRARAAAVTNIAADHLGEYGVMTLADLAKAKFAIARSLSDDGVLVLNADDPVVVGEAANEISDIWWFSSKAASSLILLAQEKGIPCSYATDTALVFFDGTSDGLSVPFEDAPVTLEGAAAHNVMNCLAAINLCVALGISCEAIRTGLTSFGSDSRDNPGRFNKFEVNGARVFVDYAHNPHSIAAICTALGSVPAKRRYLLISQPGDRSDEQMKEAAKVAMGFRPDEMMIAEIGDYLRGRAIGETLEVLATAAVEAGMASEFITISESPSQGVEVILEKLRPGDLALLLVLSDRDTIIDMLLERH
jgi:cyanophycin synthetase